MWLNPAVYLLAAFALLAGANLHQFLFSGTRQSEFHELSGEAALMQTSGSRAILHLAGSKVCAEPFPDATTAITEKAGPNFGGKGTGAEASGSLTQEQTAAINKLFERSQGIQALRDGMYRLCEANANNAIDNDFYQLQMTYLTPTLNFVVPIELCAKALADIQAKQSKTSKQDDGQNQPISSLNSCLNRAYEFAALLASSAAAASAQRQVDRRFDNQLRLATGASAK